MEGCHVYRNGKWLTYEPRRTILADPRANTTPLRFIAASAWAAAIEKGFKEEEAHNLAEAIVFKRIYNDLEYDVETTKKLLKITRK